MAIGGPQGSTRPSVDKIPSVFFKGHGWNIGRGYDMY